jgi:uncharacterized membrane protein
MNDVPVLFASDRVFQRVRTNYQTRWHMLVCKHRTNSCAANKLVVRRYAEPSDLAVGGDKGISPDPVSRLPTIIACMLWTIAVILLICWLLGFSFHVAGGLIHLLLVLAVIVVVIRLVQGRAP